MAQETVYAASYPAGSAPNPQNALGPPDGLWAGVVNANTSWAQTWTLAVPAGPLRASQTQTVYVRARKGSNSGSPVMDIQVLSPSGTVLYDQVGGTPVSTTAGNNYAYTFSVPTDTDAQGIRIAVNAVAAGGSPSARNSVEVD